MHKISFGGGFVGLLFAAGSALIFVLGFPALWYFVALAFALGVGIAVVLKVANNWRNKRNQPLSILTLAEEPPKAAQERGQERHLLQAFPKLSSI